jgi:hypothetical protein
METFSGMGTKKPGADLHGEPRRDRYMRNLLTHRNAILKQVAESHQWVKFLAAG